MHLHCGGGPRWYRRERDGRGGEGWGGTEARLTSNCVNFIKEDDAGFFCPSHFKYLPHHPSTLKGRGERRVEEGWRERGEGRAEDDEEGRGGRGGRG